jgi:UDP-N-acetylglucosamine 2-epimerase
MLKVATIVGARPQFIKAAIVSRAFQRTHATEIEELVIHTGQHYDDTMSQVFFDQLGLAAPRYNLEIGSGSHGQQTARMLIAIEEVLVREKPDWVLVFGDTNSTLAGALASAKLQIPIAHVEAGLRSWNRRMPEEVNRVVTDHLADLLFAPTETAVQNLASEGITSGVHLIGDVMQDAIEEYARVADESSPLSRSLGLRKGEYLLVTVHRAENTDNIDRLSSIVSAIRRLAEMDVVVWPVHPRTRKRLNDIEPGAPNVRLIAPVGYLEMISLERNARVVLTDSGGVQKEARWLQVPCVTLRDETEWVETLIDGWNQLTGASPDKIVAATMQARQKSNARPLPLNRLSSPGAASRIVEHIALAPAWHYTA